VEASLPTIWAVILAFAVLVYVVLDGFDLGVGILFGTTRDEGYRRTMMAAIAPVWDGNETWLVIVGAGLYGAFPDVYAIFLSALYLPVGLLMVALVLRGVAFEFRHRGERMRPVWDLGFVAGSLVAAFVQGVAIGAMVQEIPVAGGQFAGRAFHWLTPFTVLCGAGLVAGYALLGATWLAAKSTGGLRDWAYARIPWLVGGVMLAVALTFALALASDLRVMDRWMEDPWLLVFPAAGAGAVLGAIQGWRARRDWLPFAMVVVIFSAAFATMAGSFWPYLVPFSLTIEEAAAPRASLSFLFYGAGLVALPVIIVYTAAVYWIFRGKVGPE
jgi:cytochrome d ubiquinol oxidase subunit II